jgi:hypothetical protein
MTDYPTHHESARRFPAMTEHNQTLIPDAEQRSPPAR